MTPLFTPHLVIWPLFVLLAALAVGFVFLLIKAPKAAAALIGVLVILFVLLLVARSSRREQVATLAQRDQPPIPSVAPPTSWQTSEGARAPIWSDAMESEFEASCYPSPAAAAKALGMRMAEPIRRMVTDPNESVQIVLFQDADPRDLATEFKRGLQQKSPTMGCSIEARRRTTAPDEVGVTFDLNVTEWMTNPVRLPTLPLRGRNALTGQIVATASLGDRQTNAAADFAVKPWVENFGAFASQRPQEQYVIARSNGSCTSENEAQQQALQDASRRLEQMVGNIRNVGWMNDPSLLQEGGFIVDRFVQSFDGSAGKIWRQALLLDVSPAKLSWLRNRVTLDTRAAHLTWFRQIGSAVGVLALILVTYFFLNMATRGYYEWSLRIAGVILAIIAVVVFLA